MSVKGRYISMWCIRHLHSFARKPGSVATAGIGFRKATRHRQAQMPALGERWVLDVEDLADGCSYPAAARQSGPRARRGEGVVQRGAARHVVRGRRRQDIGIKGATYRKPYLKQKGLAAVVKCSRTDMLQHRSCGGVEG